MITAYNLTFPSESSGELDLSPNCLNECDPDVNIMEDGLILGIS